ncbi:MAG: hypothetical protein ACHQEA_11985 [Gaiellales bacterium]|jgi:hypothetical protein
MVVLGAGLVAAVIAVSARLLEGHWESPARLTTQTLLVVALALVVADRRRRRAA